MRPARTISLWLGLSASDGASRSVGMKVLVQRIVWRLYQTRWNAASSLLAGAHLVGRLHLQLRFQVQVVPAALVGDRGADLDLQQAVGFERPALRDREGRLPLAFALGLDLRFDARGLGFFLLARQPADRVL